MITPFSIIPKAQNKLAKYVMTSCFCSCFICVVVSMMLEKYKGLADIAALAFATAGIFFYNKYIYTTYAYEVVFDTDGTPVFVVRHTGRKSLATLCRIELSSIVDVKLLSKEERRDLPVDRTIPRYVYCPTMCPDAVYMIKMRSLSENADVFVELTDEAASLLMQYARIAAGNL